MSACAGECADFAAIGRLASPARRTSPRARERLFFTVASTLR